MNYRSEIDGLRAFAVLPVILFHAGFENFSGGYVGVDVFFVISGYLITSIIANDIENKNFSIVNFYERRARRLLPALFFVMAACLPFAWLLLVPSDLKDFGQSLVAVSSFSSNILFWIESGYFETEAEFKPLLHTWSLAIEEQFYILYPIFLYFAWRLNFRKIIFALVLIFFISLLLAEWAAYFKPSANFYLLPTRGWELLLGAFTAFYLRYNDFFKNTLLNQILSILGFGMIVYSIIVYDSSTPFPSFYALVPTLGTCLLIIFLVPKTILYKFFTLKPIVGIGLISYGIYLWHQPLLAFSRYMFLENLTEVMLIGICILSILIAWLTWRYVETPFRHKNKFSSAAIFKFTALGIVIFSTIGLWINHTDGGLKNLPLEKKVVYSRFINPTKYVIRKHSEIRMKAFNKLNDKEDILIIGDSHSEDLVNAVFEANLNDKYEFSSYYISVNCGVLFVKNKTDREDPRIGCNKMSFYNEDLKKLINSADQVWIISSWRQQDLYHMEESLTNISNLNQNFKVFGSKSFGSVSKTWYRRNIQDKWSTSVIKDSDIILFKELEELNNSLKDIVIKLGGEFINTQKVICNGLSYCSNYIGDLITYDGTHLTPFGAKILGDNLKKSILNESK